MDDVILTSPCIAVAHDDAYAAHATVTLLSVLDHSPGARLFAIVPTDFRQEPEMRRALGSALTLIRIATEQFAGLKTWAGGSVAAYTRLALAEALPLRRVIYLDSDVIVRHDLTQLWATDLSGAVLGAVPDVAFADRERLGFSSTAPYFNSGVLLIDLDRWRQENVGAQILAWAQANPERMSWSDQCAMNWVLQGRWRALDPTWNMQAQQFGGSTRWGFRFDRRQKGDPAIVHFTMPNACGRLSDAEGKPWRFLCEHPWRHSYIRTLARTPWLHPRFDDNFPHNRITRLLRRRASWALPIYLRLREII